MCFCQQFLDALLTQNTRTHSIHASLSSDVCFRQKFLDAFHLDLRVESQFLLIVHLHHQLTQLLGVVGAEDLEVLLEAQVVGAQVIVVVLADGLGAHIAHFALQVLHQARQGWVV